jgi:hypothetical protein
MTCAASLWSRKAMVGAVLSERRAGVAALVLSLTIGLAACTISPMPLRADLAVRNVHVVDTRTGRVLADRTLLIRGDRIAAIAEAS